MKLVFIFGPPASGKLTVGRALAGLTGFALFHNHLIVDAVASVFPFGSERFVRLREEFWLTVMREAAEEGRSILFTFAPEPSVAADFPERVRNLVEAAGGAVHFVRLTVPPALQEERLDAASRQEFGKLRSVALLRRMRDAMTACEAAMPSAVVTIDTGVTEPAEAARLIAERLVLPYRMGSA
jgi:hypothetical protein